MKQLNQFLFIAGVTFLGSAQGAQTVRIKCEGQTTRTTAVSFVVQQTEDNLFHGHGTGSALVQVEVLGKITRSRIAVGSYYSKRWGLNINSKQSDEAGPLFYLHSNDSVSQGVFEAEYRFGQLGGRAFCHYLK